MATSADRYMCKKCSATSIPIDGDSVRCCTRCHDVFGIDDSFDQHHLMLTIDELRVRQACSCGNDVANEFEFCTRDGACSLVCRLCNRIYTVAEATNDRINLDLDDGVGRTSTERSSNVRDQASTDTYRGMVTRAASYVGSAVWSLWSSNAPAIQEEATKVQNRVLAQVERNVTTDRPVSEGVQVHVVEGLRRVGEAMLVNLGGSFGQSLLQLSPAEGMRLGALLANHLAQFRSSESCSKAVTQDTGATNDVEGKQSRF